MLPMDLAWRLLKMPLVSESVRQEDGEYRADFRHPETGEIYPMSGKKYPEGDWRNKQPFIETKISSPNNQDVGSSTFYAPDENYPHNLVGAPYIEQRDPFVEGNEFGGEAPPVGMGTALYDLGAIIADAQGAKIVPSDARNWQAREMWAKHEDKGHWPVPVIKRQTELGEFHEDFPSSLGPVTEYHGTMNLPAVSEQGIKARSSRKRSKKYVPEQLRGQDITYTTPDQERALAFAQERAQSLGLPSSQVGVVGVRAGGLPSPIQHQEPFGVLGGTMSNVRPSAIPRANITPVLKMPIVSDSPEVRQLDVGPAHIHQFQDPVTGEVKPLYISPASNPDSENLYAGIVGNNGDRASAKFNTGDGDYASLDGIKTQEPFQRRGYMSAIYDAVEEYLQQHKKGRNLVPSDFQSDEGKAFWESRNKEEM